MMVLAAFCIGYKFSKLRNGIAEGFQMYKIMSVDAKFTFKDEYVFQMSMFYVLYLFTLDSLKQCNVKQYHFNVHRMTNIPPFIFSNRRGIAKCELKILHK